MKYYLLTDGRIIKEDIVIHKFNRGRKLIIWIAGQFTDHEVAMESTNILDFATTNDDVETKHGRFRIKRIFEKGGRTISIDGEHGLLDDNIIALWKLEADEETIKRYGVKL